MSEPLKDAEAVTGAVQTDEKDRPFEERFPSVTDQEAGAEEAPQEVSSEDAPEVLKAAEAYLGDVEQPEAVAPTAVPDESGTIKELKDLIVQMGRAQPEQTPEPEGGFDLSILDDDHVRAIALAAKDSEDPNDWLKVQAVIAQQVLEAQGKDSESKAELEALKKELADFKQASQADIQRQQNQAMFVEGLKDAAGLGETEYALAKDFVEKQELQSWNEHIQRTLQSGRKPTLEGYTPRSAYGKFLMQNPEFMATPKLMRAGMKLFVSELGLTGSRPGGVSKTAAAAPVRPGSVPDDSREAASPEEQILAAMKAAAKSRKKAPAFG